MRSLLIILSSIINESPSKSAEINDKVNARNAKMLKQYVTSDDTRSSSVAHVSHNQQPTNERFQIKYSQLIQTVSVACEL